MKQPKDRVCLFCKHFVYFSGDLGYSEYTPGYNAQMNCSHKKSKRSTVYIWEWNIYDSRTEFRTKMTTAQTCEFYDELDLKAIINE